MYETHLERISLERVCDPRLRFVPATSLDEESDGRRRLTVVDGCDLYTCSVYDGGK